MLEDWCKRKRNEQERLGKEKEADYWVFKRSKKVVRSPVNKGEGVKKERRKEVWR